MLIYCSIMVKYGTRPVGDVVILQYYGKKKSPVQLGMLLLCKSKVKYGTPPVRDVDILQYYDKIRHPSNRGCCYIAVLWLKKTGTRLVTDDVILQ